MNKTHGGIILNSKNDNSTPVLLEESSFEISKKLEEKINNFSLEDKDHALSILGKLSAGKKLTESERDALKNL